MSAMHILVAEDDVSLRDALADTLAFAGYRVTAVDSGEAALSAIERERPSLLLSDVQMGALDGHELLRRARRRWPSLPVVLMTAHGTISRAVDAMRDGACDYLVKPFEAGSLVDLVQRLAREPRSADEDVPAAEGDPLAVDPRSRDLLKLARRVAQSDVTVLISGESGTGKEVYARFLHTTSRRRNGPFVAINCAAIPDNMLEAVLFGHEKGAFTGATGAHAGKFEQAQGGTLLLDEISEMSLNLQAKLLRVLQEREVDRLGGSKVIALDVRVIATSNRNLPGEVTAGRFREDLYYRLSVMPLRLPALRDRPGDIVPLAERLLRKISGDDLYRLSADAAVRLAEYRWPGNVRELENVLQRAVLLAADTVIGPDALVFSAEQATGSQAGTAAVETAPPADGDDDLRSDLKDHERGRILEALSAEQGSRKRAAERLGISARTLRHKLAQLRARGVDIPGDAA
jgi:two-component system, response regulator FlrC